jgi:hypothetical protein
MKKIKLVFSFAALLVMFFVMRAQGAALITPVSRHGIIDLEFCKTTERLLQLRLFLDGRAVVNNILLDFIFIGAYTWFFLTASLLTREKLQWHKWGQAAQTFALSAAFFDVGENFIMLLVWEGRFAPSLMQLVFYIALIKFILIALVVLYLLATIPYLFKGKNGGPLLL